MKKLLILCAVLSVVALPALASAAVVRVGENYSLTKGETIDGNLYAAGSSLIFEGSVNGDLAAAGGEVTLKGSVTEDAALAGGTITIDGSVGDDVRVVGGEITVSGAIKGDLVLAGGDLHLLSGSMIGGDLILAGGTAIIDGAVAGDVRVAGGEVTINGEVGGSVLSRVEHLSLGAAAIIGGDLTTRSAVAADISPTAVVKGKTTNELTIRDDQTFRHLMRAAGVMSFLMFTVAGLLCFWLFKNRSKQLVAHGLATFSKELLRGILLLIILPILFILLLVTVLGVPLAIIGFLLYVATIVLAKIFAGIMLGGWINKVIFKKPDQVFTWQTVIGGNVVLFALCFVPVVGGLVRFIFMAVAFGAFWGYLYRHFWVNR